MPRRTSEEAERTRKSLLQAARRLFTEKGFDSVSLEEVAAEAAVTRGALYHHFGGKEGLFREVVREVLEEQGRRIVERAELQSDPWEGLLAGCRAFLEEAQRREYRQIVMIDAPAVLGMEAWKAFDDRYTTSTLREALKELEESRELASGDTEALSEALSGSMNQLALWAGVEEEGSRRELIERGVDIIEKLLSTVRA
jgi:AcrR family transcriptional regulator